jgi:protein tyrosine phosphatase
MDGTVWFFIILGLGILLAICIAIILCVYFMQKRKRNKVYEVNVAHSCTDTSSRSSDEHETKTGTRNGHIHVFHGMPNEGKIFEAPPPPPLTPEMELEAYNKSKKTPKSPISQTSISSKRSSSSKQRGSNAIVLEIDDDNPSYNPSLPQGIEIGKFRRQSQISNNYETRLEIDGNEVEIVDSSNYSKDSPIDKSSPNDSKKKQHINATTNRPFRIDLPDAINNAASFKTPRHFSPISARAFPQILEKLSENENEQLYAEFELLETVKTGQASIASSAANIRRNRFYDILPFEYNRIILLSRGGRKPDYINASYIEDYTGKHAYIAAQGPIGEDECHGGRRDSTVSDFWRMIWQENIDCIIMLTQCVEGMKPKCSRYWPETPGESMQVDDDLNVNFYCIVEDEHSFQREFVIRNTTFTQDRPRKVLQWHFKQWNDSSSPENAGHLLHFIRQVRTSTHSAPILVHCSAGVGRTGVFIALDQLLDKLESDESMDIFGIVNHLRHQRMNMVQNAEQYCTIYDVIALAVKQKLGQEDKDDLTSLDRNRWLSTVSLSVDNKHI